MTPSLAYKVLTQSQAEALQQGDFAGAPIDLQDGYIHLSTAAQLTETVDRHFAGQTNLSVAAVDLGYCGEALRWEVSRNGELFPHLYAALTMAAVTALAPLARGPDGAVLPPGQV
jgi:uncharacterized protein (DUF952 family)